MAKNTNTIEHCHPGEPKRIARMRGSKVRYQCTYCAKMGPWEPNPQPKVATKPGLSPKTTAKVVLPGDREHWEGMTVDSLKDHCKRNGIGLKGVKRKADIIDLIMENAR